jgi:hypothetical protein
MYVLLYSQFCILVDTRRTYYTHVFVNILVPLLRNVCTVEFATAMSQQYYNLIFDFSVAIVW